MLLDVQKLFVSSNSTGHASQLLHDITFALTAGEVVGIIGESGSGKTTLVRALTHLFPANRGMQMEGTVRFNGVDILRIDSRAMTELRRTSIRYVFQEPASALNPALRVQTQFRLLQSSDDGSPKRSGQIHRESIMEVLTRTGIKSPSDVLRSYPHQLSVGTLQRVLIAMAILDKPKLLIADEPTSAVDASIRFQILNLLYEHCRAYGMAMLLTTHDLNIVRAYADRVLVLFAGRIVETSAKDQFFRSPLHPYSAMLLSSTPPALTSLEQVPLRLERNLDGEDPQTGCKFAPRCLKVQPDCRSSEPPLAAIDKERSVRCPYWK
jgi:oligopeptide/dipeptide ABC transporter ATP-binding protein